MGQRLKSTCSNNTTITKIYCSPEHYAHWKESANTRKGPYHHGVRGALNHCQRTEQRLCSNVRWHVLQRALFDHEPAVEPRHHRVISADLHHPHEVGVLVGAEREDGITRVAGRVVIAHGVCAAQRKSARTYSRVPTVPIEDELEHTKSTRRKVEEVAIALELHQQIPG